MFILHYKQFGAYYSKSYDWVRPPSPLVWTESQLKPKFVSSRAPHMNDWNTIVRSGWISCIKIVSMILIDRALRHSRRLILSPQWCCSRCFIPIDGKIKDLNLKKNNLSEHNDNDISPRIRKRTTVESMISCWLICWLNQRQLNLQLQLHLLLDTKKMAQLDGSLQRLVLLDAFLKGQVGELQGIRGEEGRREGRSTWDPARKVFFL